MAYKVNTAGIVDDLIHIMETEDRFPVPKLWDDPFARAIPYNLSTGNSYNGFNIMALWVRQCIKGYPTNAWMTLNQARTISPEIRLARLPDAPEGKTGQKSVPIHRRDTSIGKEYEEMGDGKFQSSKTGLTVNRSQATMSWFKCVGHVFNLAQFENIPDELQPPEKPPLPTNLEIDGLLSALGCEEHISEDNRCYYVPSRDAIYMVHPNFFLDEDHWMAVRFHEYVHATGHPIRLDRIKLGYKPTTEEYAFEELVAEFGAAILSAQHGIHFETIHAGYLKSYAKVLRDDPTALVRAAAQAQKAVDLINPPIEIPETQKEEQAA